MYFYILSNNRLFVRQLQLSHLTFDVPNHYIMKQLLRIAALMACTFLNAQVGIYTTNPKSSLDIQTLNPAAPTATDGLLIPRIDTFPATNPNADQQSMLVYLTTNQTALNISGTPQDYDLGYYYWDNTQTNWIALNYTGAPAWEIEGNDNVTSGTHFLGTTNAEEVDFRVNNKHIARITELGQFELEADEKSVFIGFEAGEAYDPDNTAAEQNTFVGYQAGKDNSAGRDNVGVGAMSMTNNTTGNFNTAIGDETLENNTTGSANSAFGNNALRANINGSNNSAFGEASLDSNTSGDGNTAFGSNAGESNTTGDNNVFVGKDADAVFTGFDEMIAIGHGAEVSNNRSMAIGAFTDAQDPSSMAIGDDANVVGGSSRSIAIGNDANIDGGSSDAINIGIGSTINNGSSSSLTIGNGNNLVGGVNNAIALGNNITIQNGYDNAIGIGNGATPTKANQLMYGTITEVDLNGAVVVNASDARFKYAVTQNVPGLDFITKLRPVTYKFDYTKLDRFHKAGKIRTNTEQIETGFIAQEIEAAMKATGYDFNGLIIPENKETDNYKVSYVKFVVPLVQAVQEQQKEITALKAKVGEIDRLKQQLDALKTMLMATSDLAPSSNNTKAGD